MNFIDVLPEHIRLIQPYKPGKPVEEVERELGISAIKLASNENPLGPSPKAVDAVRSFLEDSGRYPEDTGYYLRQRLAGRYGVDMDNVIVGAGSSDILAMTCHALLDHETEILTSEGSFVLYYLFSQAVGAKLVTVPLKDFTFDLTAMAKAIGPRTRVIILANPNNPTGTMVGKDEVRRFMAGVPENTLVIFDEAYFEYVKDETYPDAFEYLTDGRPVLILRTFSKAYGLAGFRIGYGIGTSEVIEALHKVRPPFNVPSVSQVAALAALEDVDHVTRSVETNRRELDFLAGQFQARALQFVPSVANFVLVDVQLPAATAFDKLLKLGVIVRPMQGAGFPTMVRVSVGTREENVKFLTALDQIR